MQQVEDEHQGLEMTGENIETVLDEIRWAGGAALGYACSTLKRCGMGFGASGPRSGGYWLAGYPRRSALEGALAL